MDDVIYRQDAIDALTTECSWTIYDEHGQLTPNGEEIIGTLKKIPSAQKKGHWSLQHGRMRTDYIHSGYMPHKNYCSCCEKDSPYDKRWKFCPNCGADMRGEADGENS